MKVLLRCSASLLVASLLVMTNDFSIGHASAAAAPIATPAPVISAEPSSTPGAGPTTFSDLSHLKFDATGPLSASFVSPNDGAAAPIGSALIIVSTVKGAGIELDVNGQPLTGQHLGKRTVNVKSGETQYFFYGVPLEPGENRIDAIPLGAAGARGPVATEHLFGPAAPALIRAEFVKAPVADGITAVPLDIVVVDRYGHPAAPGSRLRVTIVSGDAHFQSAGTPDVLPEPGAASSPTPRPEVDSSPGHNDQARVFGAPLEPGAYIRIMLVPGLLAGPLELEFEAGDIVVHRSFYIAAHLRHPFVNGIVSGGAGTVPSGDDGDGNYDNGDARRGRVALYGSGQVGNASLLTFAYESQNELTPLSTLGAITEDPTERPYQTYGDTSQSSAPLQSNDHFYARLDSGPDSVMWGQFAAAIGPADIGGYQELLSGADARIGLGGSQRDTLTAFTARNPLAYASVAFPVSGLATLERPLNPDIVVGSDIVTLVTIDRQSGLIIAQTPLIPNIDYTLDYATGTLRFINIPLPYDANFNPNVVQVRYEYQGTGAESATSGGDLKLKLGSNGQTQLELSDVNDVSGDGNFGLLTQSLSHVWQNGSWTLTHAHSTGNLPDPTNPTPTVGGGDAYSFMLNERSRTDTIALSAQDTSIGYTDPFGGLSTPGLLAYRGSWTKAFSRTTQFSLEADGQANAGTGSNSSQRNITAAYSWKPSQRFSMLAGFIEHAQTIASSMMNAAPVATPSPIPGGLPLPAAPALGDTNQIQAQVGAQYRATSRVTVSAQESQTLSGSDIGSTEPSQTQAEIDYDLPGHGKLFASGLWSSQPAASFANSTQSLAYGVAATRALQFGIARDLSPAMSVSSDYVVDGTGNATDIYDALGVQEKLRFNKDFGANFFVQEAEGVGTDAQGFSVWGGALTFANQSALHASLGYQTRTGAAGGSTANAAVAGSLSQNVGIVGTLQRAYAPSSFAVNDNVSLAYRSLLSDRFESLLGYTRTSGDTDIDSTIANVVSFEELYRPWETLDLTSRFAYKLDGGAGSPAGGGDYAARTTLESLRARQKIGMLFDIAAELRHVAVPNATGADATDFSSELGYQVGNTARLALGYTFSGSVDPTLVGQPQRKGPYVTFTSLVDRIFGWGKDNP